MILIWWTSIMIWNQINPKEKIFYNPQDQIIYRLNLFRWLKATFFDWTLFISILLRIITVFMIFQNPLLFELIITFDLNFLDWIYFFYCLIISNIISTYFKNPTLTYLITFLSINCFHFVHYSFLFEVTNCCFSLFLLKNYNAIKMKTVHLNFSFS